MLPSIVCRRWDCFLLLSSGQWKVVQNTYTDTNISDMLLKQLFPKETINISLRKETARDGPYLINIFRIEPVNLINPFLGMASFDCFRSKAIEMFS